MQRLSYHVAVFGKCSHECASSLINTTEYYLEAKYQHDNKRYIMFCFVETVILIQTVMKILTYLSKILPSDDDTLSLAIHYAATVSPMQHFFYVLAP